MNDNRKQAIMEVIARHMERQDDAEATISSMIGAAEYLSQKAGKDRARRVVAQLLNAL